MGRTTRSRTLRLRLHDAWRSSKPLSVKAMTFAAVGLVNTLVDYSIFLLARDALRHSPGAMTLFNGISTSCRCANSTAVLLIASNIVSWTVAVSCSYVLNSSITFAAESGRKLRWRRYFAFLGSGIIGWLANTATLLFAVQELLLPVWVAKAVAILASFAVNFSLSHFVVFRPARPPGPHGDQR